ncbi:MAG: PLP-dependent aminotransferase family protein, partial [Anaerolineales bacterium]|nr:PLP-dependent aminotransferase family protein [Anaerolineales bacterium]
MSNTARIQSSFPLAMGHIQLERAATAPLHQQLYDQIRAAILSQRLEPGSQLPATRRLAATLGVSRNTVMNAIDQLHAEGYLESKVGAGTFVSSQLPEELLEARNAPVPDAAPAALPTRTLSQRGQRLNQARRFRPVPPAPTAEPIHFDPGVAAADAFPFATWARLQRRFCRDIAGGLPESYLAPAGYQPLRESIATFLKASRAIDCAAEQIIITNGSQQALYLAAQVLLDPGDEALVEEPGYNGATMAIRASSGRIIPLPVDDEGMSIQLAGPKAPGARVAFVTPSHQFPLGITMSLRRRLEILTWAEQTDGWIVEDDYDSLYRYEGQPLAALQGLDTNQRVLYVGTFSKVMFPGLRLGYIVVP